ncbi:hypothetical protein ACGFS9_24360 [Streptomyces sp. NPDC048566]|uniref:hypothetical protein n=1 Tax=Streptomyces sp. NPDC048566 TaxID=3365569 RepID=UPI00371D7AE5
MSTCPPPGRLKGFKAPAVILGFVTLCTVAGLFVGRGGAQVLLLLDYSWHAKLPNWGGLIGGIGGSLLGCAVLGRVAFRKRLIHSGSRTGGALAGIGVTSLATAVLFWSTAFIGLGDYLDQHAQPLLLGVVCTTSGLVAGLVVGLLVVVLQAILAVGRAGAGVLRTRARPGEPAAVGDDVGVLRPVSIQVLSLLMPSAARQRWLESFDESLFDYPAEKHAALVRDFALHAPAMIAWSWVLELRGRAFGAGGRVGRE